MCYSRNEAWIFIISFSRRKIFFQIKRKHSTDYSRSFILSRHKIADGICYKHFPAVRGDQFFNWLQNMRMRSYNKIRTPIRQLLCNNSLVFTVFCCIFNTPVHRYNNKIAYFSGSLNLLFQKLFVFRFNYLQRRFYRQNQAVCTGSYGYQRKLYIIFFNRSDVL